MNYELLSVVIQSAKDIVAGKGTDEDESDIQEWGAEAIVILNKDLGDTEGHLRELVDILERTVYNTSYRTNLTPPDVTVYPTWFKARKYLKSLEE